MKEWGVYNLINKEVPAQSDGLLQNCDLYKNRFSFFSI